MKILRQFEFTGAFYALVELDDGSRAELKARQAKAPTEETVLKRAEKLQNEQARLLQIVTYRGD